MFQQFGNYLSSSKKCSIVLRIDFSFSLILLEKTSTNRRFFLKNLYCFSYKKFLNRSVFKKICACNNCNIYFHLLSINFNFFSILTIRTKEIPSIVQLRNSCIVIRECLYFLYRFFSPKDGISS